MQTSTRSTQSAPSASTHDSYRVPRAQAPVDLRLDANEGPRLQELPTLPADAARRYPDSSQFERELAASFDLDPARVLVTAGGDDALLRAALTYLGPERDLVLVEPTFEMIERYALLAGAHLRPVRESAEADGRFPIEAFLAELERDQDRIGMVAVVTPNNPTGSTATAEDLRRIAAAVPDAILCVDLAYTEFADEDLTAVALTLPNALVVRTFSKAWGLAGARVGFALGAPETIRPLRAAGGPYAVAGPSLELARWCWTERRALRDDYVAQVTRERVQLAATLNRLGARARPSKANFVLADVPDPLWLRDALSGLGIAIRAFPGRRGLERSVRITCPGSSSDLRRLEASLATALAPQALLFDMDGVLADVSESYDAAILRTAAGFGAELERPDVLSARAAGAANCDWTLTQRLLAERGIEVDLQRVTDVFEAHYQGTGNRPGLNALEALNVSREALREFAARMPLGIVTGRPRQDAERFLRTHELGDLFDVVVTREDAALKPDPAPVRVALERLNVERAWMIGDTPDDVRAARAAGVVPIGTLAPNDRDPQATRAALFAAGAARVLERPTELVELSR